METQTLNGTLRSSRGKGPARRMRAAGQLPAVVYGRETESKAIWVDPKALRKALSGRFGFNAVIDLSLADEAGGEAGSLRVMVKDVQRHPVSRRTEHVDFVVIDEARRVMVEVPIELHGHAKGVALGGTLRQVLRVTDVRCLPKDIPEALSHDVSGLGIKQRALLSQLQPPEGVELAFRDNAAFAQVNAPRGAAAAAATEEAKA